MEENYTIKGLVAEMSENDRRFYLLEYVYQRSMEHAGSMIRDNTRRPVSATKHLDMHVEIVTEIRLRYPDEWDVK